MFDLFQASVDKVQFVLSRKIRPQTPDIVRSTSTDCLMKCGNLERKHVLHHFPQPCREKTITLHKVCNSLDIDSNCLTYLTLSPFRRLAY